MTETNTFMREVDEDVRREKFEQLWQRYGKVAIGAFTVLIIATAGLTYTRNQQNARFEAATTELASQLQSLRDDNKDDIRANLDKLAVSAPEGQATLARLYMASIINEKDRDAALKDLAAIAGDSKALSVYRDLAKLLSIQLRLDSDDALQLQNELSPLKDKNQPWRWSALEFSALLSLKQGDAASAKAAFEQLYNDPDTPQGIRQRAGQQIGAVGATPAPTK